MSLIDHVAVAVAVHDDVYDAKQTLSNRSVFRGKGLADPAKLLRGPGTQARWIHLEGASTLARPEVARLVDQAIASNRVPSARTGRGPVVIRSESVKPRQRRRPGPSPAR
jgi:hypothetical protein